MVSFHIFRRNTTLILIEIILISHILLYHLYSFCHAFTKNLIFDANKYNRIEFFNATDEHTESKQINCGNNLNLINYDIIKR